jgi:hypothetical protein
LREHELRLGLLDLRLGLLDLLLLAVDLGVDVADVGFGDGYLRLGLINRIQVVAIVDLRDQVAGFDMLVSVTGTSVT